MAKARVSPTVQELNSQALAGDADAVRMLADRSSAATVEEFLDKFVPASEVLRVFDLYCDAFQRSRAKALLDTLELPVVKTNANVGWGR